MTTAQDFQAEAVQHDQNAHDSFERCDTDGALSQWASGINAQLARAKAEIAEDGGYSLFERLYDVNEDREVNAKLIDGQYGAVWLVADDEQHHFNGREFIPFAGQCIYCDDYDGVCRKCKGSGKGNSRVQKQWGLEERFVRKPAHAVIKGRGRGTGGNVWIDVVEVDEVYEIYKEENDKQRR